MYPASIHSAAEQLLELLRADHKMIATAESCTGGLIAGALTEIAGSSDVVDRGFVTYTNSAKADCLGIDAALIERVGAVSEEVARAMAQGALDHSNADVAVAVTGIAGPGGATPNKPVGLVHVAVGATGGGMLHRECRFGDIGRAEVRLETVKAAFNLIAEALGQEPVVRD